MGCGVVLTVAANGWFEAHVEHAIDFIQNQNLDLVQLDQLAAKKIFQAAGRGDDPCDPRRMLSNCWL